MRAHAIRSLSEPHPEAVIITVACISESLLCTPVLNKDFLPLRLRIQVLTATFRLPCDRDVLAVTFKILAIAFNMVTIALLSQLCLLGSVLLLDLLECCFLLSLNLCLDAV